MPDKIYVGIDIAKETLDVHLLLAGEHLSTKNDTAGIKRLIKRLKSQAPKLIVMESSGGYETTVAAEMAAAGLPVVVMNPAHVRAYARAIGELAKTDAIDAYVLARFAEGVKPPIRPLATEEQRLVKELVTRRSQLIDLRSAEKNRLHRVRSPRVRESVLAVIHTLNQQIEDMDDDIDDAIKTTPIWQEKADLLETTKGVSRVTSATLVVLLPELGRLSPRAISKLVGVAPLNRDSGAMRGKRKISGGRKRIRKALYMATLSARTWNPRIKPLYDRLTKAGKPFKVVMVACMHKLLVILNAMVRKNEPFRQTFS